MNDTDREAWRAYAAASLISYFIDGEAKSFWLKVVCDQADAMLVEEKRRFPEPLSHPEVDKAIQPFQDIQ